MRFSVFSLLAARALVAGAAASNSHMPPPPNLSPGPKCPGHFQQPSPGNYRQGRICTVTPSDKDAGPSILAAAHRCNNGGTVYFPAGHNYTIASALDLTFLKDIDFAILGTIYFSDDITIWPSQVFQYPFQGASFFWRFGGENVRIYGNGQGVIDGLGQAYWTAMVTDSAVLRPILFGTDGLHRSSISGLTMRNPPNWFNFITNSSHILISDMNLQVTSLNASAPAKNTDGFDTYRSSNIVVQDSTVVNTDDCVSFKPNTTDMVVQNLHCTGCHGISVGSLGQYEGEIDIVENIYVYNVDMTSCGDSARIKVWPGAPVGSGSSSGGGTGLVRNITYNALNVNSNDQVIALTQCYGVSNTSVCTQYPSSVIITDVLFEDFSGVLSTKYQPIAGSLVCSDPTVCSNIAANNIAVTEPSGASPEFTCTNIDESELGITCVA